MVDLRGHHLVCLHFYSGEGYDSAFLHNLRNVIELAESDGVNVCAGADDVCRACPYLEGGRCRDEEEIGDMDTIALDFLALLPGQLVIWKDVRERLNEIFKTWHDRYCQNCGWQDVCRNNPLFRKLQSDMR